MINLDSSRNRPDSDGVVSVSREQCGTIGGPGQGCAVWGLSLLSDRWEFRSELVNSSLALQVPDLDGVLGGSAQPVSVRGEAQVVDDVTGIERVQSLSVGQVPQDGDAVLTTASAQGTIRRDGDGVAVSSVSSQVGAELAVGQVPDLHHLIPSAGNDEWNLGGRGESHAGDPLAVAVLVLDGVLALSQGVPQLDCLISGTTHDLSVVGGEGNGENILGVSEESSGGVTGVQVPQPKGVIPRTTESELAVTGDDNVLNVVGVSSQTSQRITERLLISGEFPKDDGLVS